MAKGPRYGEFSFPADAGFSSSGSGNPDGDYARGGKVKPFWDKPAPEGKPKHLSNKQKSQAKARASAAGRQSTQDVISPQTDGASRERSMSTINGA